MTRGTLTPTSQVCVFVMMEAAYRGAFSTRRTRLRRGVLHHPRILGALAPIACRHCTGRPVWTSTSIRHPIFLAPPCRWCGWDVISTQFCLLGEDCLFGVVSKLRVESSEMQEPALASSSKLDLRLPGLYGGISVVIRERHLNC